MRSRFPPGLVVTDELRVLDESRCRRAAQGLTGQGATMALFLVEEGEVWSRLREAGLTRGTRLNPHVMVVYASRDPRYSELRVGSNFSEALPRPTLERLRTGVLNPALAAGSYEQGFTDTLQALEVELARGRDTMATGRLWALGALAGLGLGWIAMLVLRAAWDGRVGRSTSTPRPATAGRGETGEDARCAAPAQAQGAGAPDGPVARTAALIFLKLQAVP